jgi:hypothetical protein
VVEFYLKLRLILSIIIYLTYICWEINNFVIKSDIFRRFFICKNILKKLSCYHDNYFRYFMFGKYNGFVSKARISACMYFLVKVILRWLPKVLHHYTLLYTENACFFTLHDMKTNGNSELPWQQRAYDKAQ